MKKTLLTLILACAVASAQSHNSGSSTLSAGSSLIVGGSVMVVAGSMAAVAGVSSLAVASVEVVGESVLIVLEGASEAARVSIKMSAAAAAGLSMYSIPPAV